MTTDLIIFVVIAAIILIPGVLGLLIWEYGPKGDQRRKGRAERREQQARENRLQREADYEDTKKATREALSELRAAKARGERVSGQDLAALESIVRGYDAAEKMHAQRQFSGYRDGTGRLESRLWTGDTRPIDRAPQTPEPSPAPEAPVSPTPEAPPEAPRRDPEGQEAPTMFSRAERARQWTTVRAQFREHLVRMSSYETDPALAIDYPAFNDLTVPEVSAMVKALRTATNLQDATDQTADVGGSDALLIQFRDAVQDFSVAMDTAERAARRLRWSHLPAADREDLDQIRNLLNHAENPGNTDEARTTYYAKLQRVIRKLNDRHGVDVVPAQALATIEAIAHEEIAR